MLCRAVLAVFAVTCTFSPIARTISQGTELVQLKDLVCVLWFSGLKKEDMDVNLLTKLRRHNINIDMNNDTMQRECSINRLSLTSRTEKPVFVTTTTILPTTIGHSNSTTAVSNDKNFEAIVKYITDMQTLSRRNFVNENRETPILPKADNARTKLFEPIYSTRNIAETNSMKKKDPIPKSKLQTLFSDDSNLTTAVSNDKDFEPSTKYITDIQLMSKRNFLDRNTPTVPIVESARTTFFEPGYSTKNVQEINSIKDTEPIPESKLQNVLSFWQTIAKSNDKRTQKKYETITETTPGDLSPKYKQKMRLPISVTATSLPYYSGSTQYKPVLARWLAEFLSSKMNGMSVATSTERKDPNDIGELMLPFYKDLIHSYDSSQSIQDIVNGEVSEGLFDKLTTRNERPYTFDKKITSLLRSSNIGDFSKSNERFDNPFNFNMLQKIGNTKNLALRQRSEMDTSDNQKIERHVFKTKRNEDGNQKITKQTIQDIADSVKTMLLKDFGVLNATTSLATTKVTLAPEISNTTNNTTLSNDPITATTINPQNATGNVYQVIDKILDLYKRLKVISDKINATSDVNKNASQQNKDVHTPQQNKEGYGSLNIKDDLSETLQKNMFNRMTNVKHMLVNPFRDLTRQEIQKLPSIIQTNSGEIPPLLLPMPKPSNIINQVVVVSTAKPTKKVDADSKSRYEAFMKDLNNRGHTSYDKSKSQKDFSNYKKYSHFVNFDNNKSRKEIKKKYNDQFIQTHDFGTPYIEGRKDKIKHYNNDNDKENDHINYFDFISNYYGNSAKVPTNGNNEKFHEKLENEDGRSGGNHKIFGRNKEFYMQDRNNFGQDKDNFMQDKESFRNKEEVYGQNKDVRGHNKRLYGSNKEIFGHNKEFYGQSKEIFGNNKEGYGLNKEGYGPNKEGYGPNKEIFRILNRYKYDRQVAPRHQQPLNMKKLPYDDTHFRNFLKTQQKVNDMLEKILETKNTLPYSVEMT